MRTQRAGGSDRDGYNLICIADRVISIRVTTQSSLPVKERSVYLKWVAHSTGRLFRNYLPACSPASAVCIRFSRGVAFKPLYRRLQNNRADVVIKRKLPKRSLITVVRIKRTKNFIRELFLQDIKAIVTLRQRRLNVTMLREILLGERWHFNIMKCHNVRLHFP